MYHIGGLWVSARASQLAYLSYLRNILGRPCTDQSASGRAPSRPPFPEVPATLICLAVLRRALISRRTFAHRFGALPSPAFGKRVAARQVSASRFGSALVFRAARRALRVRNGRCYSRALTAEAEGRASSDKRTRPGAEEPQASPAQLPVHTPSAVARHHHYHPPYYLLRPARAHCTPGPLVPAELHDCTSPTRFTTHHPHVVLLHLAAVLADGELLPDGPRSAARVRVLPAGPPRCAIHVCRAPAEQCAQRCSTLR